MIVAGIDVGSRTTACVIFSDAQLRSSDMVFTSPDSTKTATEALEGALKRAEICFKEIDYLIATGYGRILIPFADEHVTEISCHARGAHWFFATARTVLDMGGQDCKVIRIDSNGNPVNFAMNDKCAAGTGRFLEIMANTLKVPLEEIGLLSLESHHEVKVSSKCTVFAKSEVSYLVRMGENKKDVLGGLHEAVSERVFSLIKTIGIEKDFVITGGVAKNIGIVRRVEKLVGSEALIPHEPQLVGAIGAAVIAMEYCGRNGPASRIGLKT
jgi:(R)-2-hydroxyacyl-CoA dehydratese activating ATPase